MKGFQLDEVDDDDDVVDDEAVDDEAGAAGALVRDKKSVIGRADDEPDDEADAEAGAGTTLKK